MDGDQIMQLRQFNLRLQQGGQDVHDASPDRPSPEDVERSDTALHIACRAADLDSVRQVLVEEDVNSRGLYGRTAVMVAARRGLREMFDLIVSKGGDLTLGDDNGNNILHLACLGGDVDIVQYVLSQDIVDINSRGQYGRTPVMFAAEKGHGEVLDILVSQGGDVSRVDGSGNSILHVACIGGSVDMVKHVLSQDIVDINGGGQYGRTPLMSAVGKGRRDVFDLLVSNGGDVSLVDSSSNSILHLACIGGHIDMVKYVLSLDVVDINVRGQYGRTPMMSAAWRGHRKVFDLLVPKGGDVSVVDDDGNNILHLACIGGQVEMVNYILSQDIVDTNSRGQFGRTPLMIAAEKGQRIVFDLLVSKGGDVSLADDDGNNILHVACIGGHVEMVNYVLSHGPLDIKSSGQYGRTPVLLAAEKGHRDVFDLLVSKGDDVSVIDDDGNNILHMACIGGQVQMVQYVLSQDIVDINSTGQHGRTPVMFAAEKGHRDVFDLLVSKNADATLVDDDSNNIFHVACIGGHAEMVKHVLSQNIVDIPMDTRRTHLYVNPRKHSVCF
ncbi:ankyrin repeat domain-containing protein 50-like [Haliotis rufescens]|uniref:ankyrin repeat domain-containing protein 50-like n=1 Tax=Haliotis rufescens TaxID=6454 RepID=UPI00201F50BB|nr:ankyrin repeat domain-containing protein 50-like [Haliotis rufescens]XP_048244593.1 ankyrin repeat domain-containing protein 50-like [Haliotis rufescens]XP_048244598.1 ankyrin repeat domain-containing protein 50-like [Haliotis rufescens]XP_048244608.1 ankyrin repeat domain-containing protein 50-like [Haliotis rufescens]XP_048244613.1 ankyrin repeat domain-containing protein 50-like [Haliotis rufescens]XP_048244616.1 ankyrin repeat domain-containing protein 50-like [Haliotis rufescens]XP_04